MRKGRLRTWGIPALAVYLAVSTVCFGIPVLVHHGEIIGTGGDPEIFIWSLGWWPHAILHGENAIFSHVVWSPVGVNLAWATSVPGLAVLAAPLTLAAGPASTYNVLAVLLPALAGWTAYILCHHITRSFWPSLAGGYLFGFSSYMLGQMQGHMHMTAVFLVPLVALLVLRYVERSLSERRLVVLLGTTLAFQIGISTEVAFTLTLALGVTLVAAYLLVPTARERLRQLVLPLAGAYVLASILASPLLVNALLHPQEVGNPPSWFPGDLLNIVSPTRLTWINSAWSERMSDRFKSWTGESGLYLGLPLLAILASFAWSQRRSATGRFLVAVLAVGVFCELGTELDVAGKRYLALPWAHLVHLPGLDRTITVRFSMYVALAAAVIAARWAASTATPALLRGALLSASIVTIAPHVGLAAWHEQPERPAFFASGTYRECLAPDDNVLVLPIPQQSDAMLWQAEARYSFRMADGYLSALPPRGIPDWNGMLFTFLGRVPKTVRPLIRWARIEGVSHILVDPERGTTWTHLLAADGWRPTRIGGVDLYGLRSSSDSLCPSRGRSSEGSGHGVGALQG
jgi:hypothetical protein